MNQSLQLLLLLDAPMAAAETMRAMIKEEEVEGYVLKHVDVPEPSGDDVLLRVGAVAICGSDIALYKWTPMAKVSRARGGEGG